MLVLPSMEAILTEMFNVLNVSVYIQDIAKSMTVSLTIHGSNSERNV